MRCAGAAAAVALLASAATASTLRPPVLPLTVRNPYLSTWLANARDVPWHKWPMFWTGSGVGLGVLAYLPDSQQVFPLLGRPHDSLSERDRDEHISFPTYKGAKYDASTTNLSYSLPAPDKYKHAADLQITLSFLSPVTPTSTLRQSLPAAYLSVFVEGSFDVSIYIDVNGQWVSGKGDVSIEWDLSQQEPTEGLQGLKSWKIRRQNEELFTEFYDHAEWGRLLFTGPDDARHESGASSALRQRFARTGTLQNENDGNFRRIMDDEPVFAFSKDFELRNLSSKGGVGSDGTLFTFTHVQDPVAQFASARGLTHMRPLWKWWFGDDEELVRYHYNDFANADFLARNYSEQLRVDAYESGSDSYVDIVALSARQALGATTFSGTPDNPLLFLKEISSDGNCQTVDVIFPAFPFFLYTNPRWAAYLLEPLLEHQLSRQYPNKYSMHDLGSSFPNITGHPDGRDEYMPVEECGDMLIMGLALVNSMTYATDEEAMSIWSTLGRRPEDETKKEKPFALHNLRFHEGISHIDAMFGGGTMGVEQAKQWVEGSYDLWKQWTGYLVEFALEPANQLSTDDFAGWLPLQTNLALKGIIGIKAFSELAALIGRTGDADEHRNISDVYVTKWEKFGMASDGTHAKLAYHWYGSWTTLYSLYSDALLCFHPTLTNASTKAARPPPASLQQQSPLVPSHESHDFIPHHIYTAQSKHYGAILQKYGLPLDSRHLYTKSDWEFYAAAVAEGPVRSAILDRVARWLNETSTDRPFTDLYDTEGTGGFPGPWFFARPVVGGHFAFLALERACGGGLKGARGHVGVGRETKEEEMDEL